MDLICFSHLRWNFVYQRPQHLMKRFAQYFRVFYIEEPEFGKYEPHLKKSLSKEAVWIMVPHLPRGLDTTEANNIIKELLQKFFVSAHITNYISWYYTPMAIGFSASLEPQLTVYDCMDELSAFKNPPHGLKSYETELVKKADLIFTGGQSLYEAKKHLHSHVHPFPSSIDKNHFDKARIDLPEPADQVMIGHPRIGFFGVIDERLDIDLLRSMATLQPGWNFIIIGPVVKIDPDSLPALPNIYYLRGKSYDDLPTYLSGWDVAIMPFAINESTQFISPTKTPEYLAGGKPVVSTPIKDVIHPYGEKGLVHIAGNAEEFISAIQKELHRKDRTTWLATVDAFLAENSWDKTAQKMIHEMNTELENKRQNTTLKKEDQYV